jgi:hypothetical protein
MMAKRLFSIEGHRMKSPAWTRKAGKNAKGGLNEAGRPYPNLVDNMRAARKKK